MLRLVLLPGMDGTGELFAPFVSALGLKLRVTVVRYPTAESLDYAQLESIAQAALPSDEPFILLGESFSGPIAVSIAASDLRQLKGLVLCCSFVRNPRPLFSSLRRLTGVLPINTIPRRLLGRLLLDPFATEALQGALAHALAQVSPSVMRARVHAVLSVDVCAELKAVRVPVLYLRGSHDRVVPLAASQLIRKLKPDTRVVRVEAPHFLLQAAPAAAADLVREFVQEVGRR